MMRRHAELLAELMGEERGCTEFRKHVSWYLKGFAGRRRDAPVAGPGLLPRRAGRAARRAGPGRAVPGHRARRAAGPPGVARERVALPEGWLDDTDGTGCHVAEDTTEVTGG